MRFHVLGPLEVREGAALVKLPPKQRDLLAALLCTDGATVSAERLIECLWGTAAPRSAMKSLQIHIHRLRRTLHGAGLLHRPPGYALLLDRGDLDSCLFHERVRQGREAITAGHPQKGADLLRSALGLWRGEPYEGQDHIATVHAEAIRLAEMRLEVLEDLFDTELALGRHAALTGELRGLVAAHPFRERLRIQLMLALYRTGRVADALDVCRAGRTLLADELGLDPGPALRRLELAMLTYDPALDSSTARDACLW
ncbi:AfsR/SARP family transcriptional regulator [Actinomadura rudentiformis]|nr:AfsR/SARP family transcriptional regulator [Actinomadura rudentiformis]